MATVTKPIIDFDHHSFQYTKNWEAQVRGLHAMDFPLAWTEAHGGYWVLGSWAECKRAAEDWETFSSDNDITQERRGGKGASIPQRAYALMLSESDPPFSNARRKIEIPFFMPKALRSYEAKIDKFIDDAIEGVRGRNEADLLMDLIVPITARTTLSTVGYGDNWREVASEAHRVSYLKESDPTYPLDMVQRVQAEFRRMLAARRVEPKSDIISALAHGQVLGQPLTDEEGESMMTALVFGGFDTTTTAVINALIWLEGKADVQQQLLSDPKLLDNAIEEWLRAWPPSLGIARTVMHDVEIGGRHLRKGERIYLWYAAANRDPAKFENPETIQIDRPKVYDHLAFSGGGHRCLGAPLAKMEIRAMIRAVLTRMPGYHIQANKVERYPSFGSVSGYLTVPMLPGPVA